MEKQTDTKQEKTKTSEQKGWDAKQYLTVGLVVFLTFCCCILFFFMIYRYNGFAEFWKKLVQALQPVIIGLVIAYLLNPVMKFLEGYLLKLLKPRMKSERRAKKLSRGIAIVGALLVLVGIFVILIASIVPSIVASVESMVTSLPTEVNNLIDWINHLAEGDSKLADVAEQILVRGSDYLENFMQKELLPQAQTYITSITSGVINVVKFLLNILIGLIISIYVMASKETFAGQAKKIIYAVFKPVRANVIVETVRKSNEIFGGFISGKILDSAIIGVIAYVVLSIMKMPDTVLVAVIIGVTNVIPFFGPFIGAIPSFLIIVLQNPIQGLYFLIFVIILQQVDGNIIGPKILGDSTGLSSFWVVFAILLFGGMWGFFGMLLGVPIMAVIYYVVERVVEYWLRKRKLPEDTVSYVRMTSVDRKTNELRYEEAVLKEKAKVEKEKDKEETEATKWDSEHDDLSDTDLRNKTK